MVYTGMVEDREIQMKKLSLIAILSAFVALLLPQFTQASCGGCNQAISYEAPIYHYPKVYKKHYKKRHKHRRRYYRSRACPCSCPTPQSCINPNYVYSPRFSCRGYYYGRWYLGYHVGWDSCDLLVEYGVTVRVYRYFPV